MSLGTMVVTGLSPKPVCTSSQSSLYKVCILTAGKGTRNRYAIGTNKALLPIGNATALDYIVDKFPPGIEIVIAVGHRSQLVREYASEWYNVTFVEVGYEGECRGPGYSLLCCRGYLQCPFIYMACDTLVLEDIPEPTSNWIGVAEVQDKLPYLTIQTKGRGVTQVYDKGDENATNLASIGLVGVRDYKAFWEGLERPTIVEGEHQDTSGIQALIPHGLQIKRFTWYDTGTTEGYEHANREFNKHLS